MAINPVVVYNENIAAIAVFDGDLYAVNHSIGLLRWDGETFVQIVANFTATANSAHSSYLFVHNGQLFVAFRGVTSGYSGPRQNLRRWDGASSWVSVVTQFVVGFGTPYPIGYASLGSDLYTVFTDGRLRRLAVNAWLDVASVTLPGGDAFRYCLNLGGELFCGTDSSALYKYGSGSLVQVAPSISMQPFSEFKEWWNDMMVLDGKIYVGKNRAGNYPMLCEWDGVSGWTTLIPNIDDDLFSSQVFLRDGFVHVLAIISGGPNQIYSYRGDGEYRYECDLVDVSSQYHAVEYDEAVYIGGGQWIGGGSGPPGRLTRLDEAVPVPNLITPANGATGLGVVATLTWEDVDADSYTVQVSTSSDFSSLVVDEDVADTEFGAALDFETQYYWRVRARSGSEVGEWSVTWGFVTSENPPSHSTVLPSSTARISHARILRGYRNREEAARFHEVMRGSRG